MKNLSLLMLFLVASLTGFSQKSKTEVTRFYYQINTRIKSSQPVDTTLPGSQVHHPLYSSFSSWSDLGNTGLPAIANRYRPVREALNPLMFEGTDGYGAQHNDIVFYSAKSPYSLLNYNSGGTADKNGQTIKAIFARNLRKNSNITVLGSYYNSDGHFADQKCNSSAMDVNYQTSRKNYTLITGLSRRAFTFSENGGLKSDEQLAGSDWPKTLPVNLSGAPVIMKSLVLQGVQTTSFHLGAKDTLSAPLADSLAADSLMPAPDSRRKFHVAHTFRVSNVSRRYSDLSSDAAFYRNTYTDEKNPKDSISFQSWRNDISMLSDTLRIGKHPITASGGLNPDFYRYQFADSISSGFSLGLNVKASTKGQYGNLDIAGSWVAAGYPAGDYNLDVNYSFHPGKKEQASQLSFELYSRGYSPDPVIRNYQSIHFRWSNDFSRQHESGINVKWNIPKIHSVLAAEIVTNRGRIYFDTLGLPAQLNTRMNVISFHASKSFAAGPFRSSLSALVQYSTSDKIRLPLFVGSTSTYMHHDIKFPSTGGELQVEYGFDLSFNTGFYGYAYMPSTGIFYGQNEKILGNYPNLTGFAQMKVKRTRLFVAWCQTFADLLPEQSFAVLHYPSMRPHLKYGLYWHFYD